MYVNQSHVCVCVCSASEIDEKKTILEELGREGNVKALYTLTSDINLMKAGWVAVVVEQPLFDPHTRIAGTPDAIFYHPDEDRFLVTDLKHSATINPFTTNSSPSKKFEHVFGKKKGIFDTQYHQAALQLNFYAFLLRCGYATEIRRAFGHNSPGDGLYRISLEVLCVHDTFQGVKIFKAPFSLKTLNLLIDAWHTYAGSVSNLQSAIVSQAFVNKLAALPSTVNQTDTMLGGLLKTVTSGSKALPNDRFYPNEALRKYNCPYSITVTAYANGQTTIEEHHAHVTECKAAAENFRIPQPLDSKLLDWITTAFDASLTIDEVERALFTPDFPLLRLGIEPPPRPIECHNPIFMNCPRFTPTRTYLKELEQVTRRRLRFDVDDQTSLEKKINQLCSIHNSNDSNPDNVGQERQAEKERETEANSNNLNTSSPVVYPSSRVHDGKNSNQPNDFN